MNFILNNTLSFLVVAISTNLHDYIMGYWLTSKFICSKFIYLKLLLPTCFMHYGHSLFPLCNVTFYRNFNPDQKFGPVFVFSIRLALLMEIIGFSVRLLSSFLWVQMYRLGVSTMDNTIHRADCNVRDSFVNPPTNEVARQTSNADEILGGSVYDPAYYSSLFEDIQETQHMTEVLFTPVSTWKLSCVQLSVSSLVFSCCSSSRILLYLTIGLLLHQSFCLIPSGLYYNLYMISVKCHGIF